MAAAPHRSWWRRATPPHRSKGRPMMAARIAAIAALALLVDVAAAQPDPAKAAPMTEAQIQTVLRARGYADVDAIARDGGLFRIRGASRYGEAVGDIVVDAVTGDVQDERLSEAQARRMLRDRGFEEVSEVRQDGAMLVARGRRAGNPVEVRIDPRRGAVTQTLAGP
jgi:Peptidase propeptide and YPEB domain